MIFFTYQKMVYYFIRRWIFIGTEITGLIAFGAGALSFLSPCTLPMLPLYLSYITGKSVKEINENQSREFRINLISHSLFFLLGVSTIYLSLGLGISFLGDFLTSIMTGSTGILLQRLAGVFMVVLGLVIGGWLKIPLLAGDTRKGFANRSTSFASSFFIGLGFAAGWTPCIGPIFSGILLLGMSTGAAPLSYLLLYILGFSLPFIIMSLFISKSQKILKHSDKLMKIGGVLMVVIGLLMLTGQLAYFSEILSIWLQDTPFQNLG